MEATKEEMLERNVDMLIEKVKVIEIQNQLLLKTIAEIKLEVKELREKTNE